MKPECLIFDLDNTLYDYNGPNQISNDAVFHYFNKKFDLSIEDSKKIHKEARNQTHVDLFGSAASHNRILYFQKMLELINVNSMKHAFDLYNLYWDSFLNEMKLFESVEDVLVAIKNKKIKMCILTDLTTQIQYRKILRMRLDKYFDFLVTSEEVGYEKPNPSMFKKAIEKLGTTKEKVIMIGDNWKKDIEGADSFGMRSIWINHKNDIKKIPTSVTEVNDFNGIKMILNRWN